MTFDITFLGSDGGPVEGHNSAILLKPASLSYKDIVSKNASQHLLCIDAGAGIGSLISILTQTVLSNENYVDKSIVANPFQCLESRLKSTEDAIALSHRIFDNHLHYVITHPHLDHVNALVVNSAGFKETKFVHGSPYTIEALAKYVFNGVIWPRMNDFHLVDLRAHQYSLQFVVNDSFEVRMFELSHGDSESAAYLVTSRESSGSEKLLVFGDCESDLISRTNTVLQIWKSVAPYVLDQSLKGIIIECSLCNSTATSELYGHITPYYLVEELKKLQAQCRLLNPEIKTPLKGLHVIVNHIKDEPSDPRKVIQKELFELNSRVGLGCIFSLASDGVSVSL